MVVGGTINHPDFNVFLIKSDLLARHFLLSVFLLIRDYLR